MTTLLDAPLQRPVLGIPTLYTGFIRVFVPKGSPGYSGENGCGGCCSGVCKDPRMLLQYANGNLIGVWGYAGSYQDVPVGDIELPNANLRVQWIPGATTLEAEMECPCNPSETWDLSAGGSKTVGEASNASTTEDPYRLIATLKAELLVANNKVTALTNQVKTYQNPPPPTPEEEFNQLLGSLEPICGLSEGW